MNALKCHSGMQSENVDGTVLFLKKIIDFWKIVNVKSTNEGIRLKDSIRDPIFSRDDIRLDDLITIAKMANNMNVQSDKRVRCSLTND